MADELDLLYNDDEVPSYTQQVEEKKKITTESAKQAGSKNDQVIAPSGGIETQPSASETPQINVEFAHDFEDEVAKPATTIKLTDNASQLEDVPPTRALYISDLEWWTSDNDLMIGCVEGLETAEDFSMRDTPITNIVFLDHKVNGKSKGVAYVEFKTEQDAIAARARLSLVEFSGKKARVAFVNTQQLGSPFLDTPLDSLGKFAISNISLIPGNKDVNQQFEHKSHRGGRGRGGGSYRGPCALQVDNTCDAKQSVINGFITDTKQWPGDSSPLTIQKVTQVFSNSPVFNSGDWKLTVMCKSQQKSSLYDFFLDSESYGLIWFAFETQAWKGQVSNAAKLKKYAPQVPKRASQKLFNDFVHVISELLLDVFPRQGSFSVPKDNDYLKLTFDSYALRGQMNSVVTSGLPIHFESPEQGQRLAEMLQSGFGVKLSRYQTPKDFIQSRTSSFLMPDQREQVLELATWSGYMDPKEVLGQ